MADENHGHTTVSILDKAPSISPLRGRLTFPSGNKSVALLMSNKMLLGRDESSDIVFPDTRISRKHAMIAIEYDEAKFSDLNSSNGSFRRGERITDDILLVTGDVINLAHAFDLGIHVGERNESVTSVSVTLGETRYVLFQNEIFFGGPAGDAGGDVIADFILPDRGLGPKHAQLEFLFDDVVISSLADEAPVMVNGQPQKSASLQNFDTFTIGTTTFVWHSR